MSQYSECQAQSTDDLTLLCFDHAGLQSEICVRLLLYHCVIAPENLKKQAQGSREGAEF